MEIKNAKIESTMLGIEDHGIMTFMLHLDYGGISQGAGGYGIEHTKGIALIRKVLEIVGVREWEDLKGKHVRVKAHHTGVDEIGHFLENNWLNFKDFFKEE